MAEFTPINTQEEFDAQIKDRLARQETKIRGEYSDYEDLKTKAQSWDAAKETYEKTIADNKTAFDDLNKKYTEATGKIAQYETDALKTKIALESGLPVGMISYLKGSTEEEIKKSAEDLGKFAKGGQVSPLADPEGESHDGDYAATGKIDTDRAMRKFKESLKIINE